MMRLIGSLAISASLLIAFPVAAQSSDQDLRCLVLGEYYQGVDKDAGHKLIASAVALYFLGRVDARLPFDTLKARYVSEAKGLQGQNTGPFMNDCAQQLRNHEKAMVTLKQEIGKSLAGKPGLHKK